MTLTDPLLDALRAGWGIDEPRPGIRDSFPFQPVGTAVDMGTGPDGTPLVDPRIFDSAEFRRNPYPYYRLLRDHHPVFHDALHNAYFVTRYDDITAGYLDETAFNTIPKGSSSGVLGNTQLELSGVEHHRRRNVYGRHLIGKALNTRVPAIRRLAAEMIAEFAGPRPADWVEVDAATGRRTIELARAFANDFPIRVVCQVLGIPDEARADFFYWYSSMMLGLGGSDTQREGVEARQHLEDYVTGLVERRRREPGYLYDDDGNVVGKDIITELCDAVIDGDVMSTEEITSNIALVVGGGGETTRGAILNMWYLLLQHPEQYERVLAESSDDGSGAYGDAGAWDRAFHETLRHSTPIGGQPRHTNRELVMHGVTIPAGALVHMVDVSANHDERVYADPERFDIDRPDLYAGRILRSGYRNEGRCSHMAFGVGPHLCPGAWISHQEAVVGSQILAASMRDPRIVVERMPKDLDGESLAPIGLGSIRELWISFEPT
jgi:pulcherriminic acid synthase